MRRDTPPYLKEFGQPLLGKSAKPFCERCELTWVFPQLIWHIETVRPHWFPSHLSQVFLLSMSGSSVKLGHQHFLSYFRRKEYFTLLWRNWRYASWLKWKGLSKILKLYIKFTLACLSPNSWILYVGRSSPNVLIVADCLLNCLTYYMFKVGRLHASTYKADGTLSNTEQLNFICCNGPLTSNWWCS